jgi:hypothetical protein
MKMTPTYEDPEHAERQKGGPEPAFDFVGWYPLLPKEPRRDLC